MNVGDRKGTPKRSLFWSKIGGDTATTGGGAMMELDENGRMYDQWKTLVPYVYDFFTSHKQYWPSLSARWGPVIEDGKWKTKHHLYHCLQCAENQPQQLIISCVDIIKPRVASSESLSTFHENYRSPFIRNKKHIFHPGEINKIRECALQPNLVVTHTDSPETYVWDIDKQQDRTNEAKAIADKNHLGTSIGHYENNTPDLVLEGHTADAPYALAGSKTSRCFASGGVDKKVVLWNLEDAAETLGADGKKGGRASMNSGGLGPLAAAESGEAAPRLGPKLVFEGHTETVEAVEFHPTSSDEIVSVGDDQSMCFWDARGGSEPALKVENAHDSDIHYVSWNSGDDNLLATGGQDASVKVWDRRKTKNGGGKGMEVACLKYHDGPVNHIEWSPDKSSVLASAGDDGVLNIWDLTKTSTVAANVPPQLLVQHVGHRGRIEEFQWNVDSPWTLMSTSTDSVAGASGGTIQVFRINDLIYNSQEVVMKELEEYKSKILGSP
mmetsp:Transcript_6946/g.17049  ORF Transcript_6946/g.17049 Transcript_6946/m.17049 type:complete len:496 (+) Transcript_6946:242-1729(+)